MTVNGYELQGEWKNSTSGKTATAKKGGKTYFLKKYQTPVAPIKNGSLDAKTIAHNQVLFDEFVAYRKRINSTIRTLTGPGGNIIIPNDEFIDGNNYVEASEFVPGVVSDDDLETVLASLSADVKLMIMKTAAGALYSIHNKHIIHSDLKLKNVLLAKNASGNYVAKLIDFDSSYFANDKPESIELIGTIDYYSPELGTYANVEDGREEYFKLLTEKSDIFSLGLMFHYYLCGSFPTPVSLTEKLRKRQEKGKKIYCWVALVNGCELELSPDIPHPAYVSLISDMLSLKAEDRPAAKEVLERLNKQIPPVIEEPWPEHKIMLNKDKIQADGILGLRKIKDSGELKYESLDKKGKKAPFTKAELLSKGYAKELGPEGFCGLWPEHKAQYTFDLDKIKSIGFVACEQTAMGAIKGYTFYRADSRSQFFKIETCCVMKLAKKTGSSSDLGRGTGGGAGGGTGGRPGGETGGTGGPITGFANPWPEHKIEFLTDAIKAMGYTGSKQDTMGGVHGYTFSKADGSTKFINSQMVVILKMARKL